MKLVACDLDGTILDDHKQPDQDLKDVIEKLRERDIGFTIVSGRNEEIMHQFVDHFDVTLPYVTNNGGNIYQKHNCLLNDCIPVSCNSGFLRALYQNGIPFRAFAEESFYNYSTSPFFEERMGKLMYLMTPFDPSEDYTDRHFYKITTDFIDHKEVLPDFLEMVHREFPELTYLKAENYVYCANSKTATKGHALKSVCEMIGIGLEDVIAFGDNGNDLSMLEAAGVSVAMGNSLEDIKRKCDYVCEDNNHMGVASFLKEYFKL